VILASGPTIQGIDAVELAAEGLPGARGILDGDQGFVATMTRRPLVGAFSGVGETWKLADRVVLRHDASWTERLGSRSVITLAGGKADHLEIDFARADLAQFEMAFGATVTVTLADGRRIEREKGPTSITPFVFEGDLYLCSVGFDLPVLETHVEL
jgi:hypothetical protein